MAERPASRAHRPPALAKRRLFGFTLETDFDFSRPLPPGDGPRDLRLTRLTAPPAEPVWRGHEPVFRSSLKRNGESVSNLYRVDGREILRFDSEVEFEVGARRIEYHFRDPTPSWLAELRFLGPVMVYWMECRGVLCLHASTVAIDDRAVLFVSAGGGGKTTLAAALLEAGHCLLSDDVAALQELGAGFVARPGYPEMRMWPTTAQHFVERWQELQPAHPLLDKLRATVGPRHLGRFRDQPLPVAAVYLLDRRPSGPVELTPVAPRPALIELVARSFAPHLVEAAGLQQGRLDRLGRLIGALPVRRLRFPAGHERLPGVITALIADLGRLGA